VKRFLIFALGPIAGLLAMVLITGVPGIKYIPVMLVAAYVIGGAPALITWLLDWWLASRLSAMPRMIVVACVGAGTSMIPGVILNNIARGFGEFLMLAFAGAAAGAACSWLSNPIDRSATVTNATHNP
jgi:hypothetical protein